MKCRKLPVSLCLLGPGGILNSNISPGWIKIPFPNSSHESVVAFPALILPTHANGLSFPLNANDDLIKTSFKNQKQLLLAQIHWVPMREYSHIISESVVFYIPGYSFIFMQLSVVFLPAWVMELSLGMCICVFNGAFLIPCVCVCVCCTYLYISVFGFPSHSLLPVFPKDVNT